jgi:hypothetical protein
MHRVIGVWHIRVIFVAMGPRIDRYTTVSMLHVVEGSENYFPFAADDRALGVRLPVRKDLSRSNHVQGVCTVT